MKYYAVKSGKIPGIYGDWESCKPQVKGFKDAKYKSFKSYEDAKLYMGYTTSIDNFEDSIIYDEAGNIVDEEYLNELLAMDEYLYDQEMQNQFIDDARKGMG